MANVLDLFRLDGKKAIVTGGSGGLGQELVRALLEAGADVVVMGVSGRVFPFCEQLTAEGYNVLPVQADLSDYDALQGAFDKAMEFLGGHIDILVNGAGAQLRCPAEDYPPEEWHRILATNLDSAFFLSQMAGRVMLEQGKGSIVNICSISSVFGGRRIPAYTASKCGMQGITRSLSNEWCKRGVRVNCIAPGYMTTELTATMRSVGNQMEEVSARIPMGRWGDGTDLKGALIFLASDASAYASGSTLTVDGGYCCS